jgi:hypothetical protein
MGEVARRRWHRLQVALVLVLVAGCRAPTSIPAEPPSEAEALAYLDQVVAVVERGDLSELCAFGSGTCAHTLQGADGATTPTTKPVVVRTRILPSRLLPDGTWRIGGRILELCGVDGLGERYDSEILVFREGDRIIGKEPVFWIGLRIADGDVTAGSGPAMGACPP